MAKKRDTDQDPTALRTVDSKGKAPGHRIKSAHQAFEIANDLNIGDKKGRIKRGRIFRAYNRFPPTEYSTIFKDIPNGTWSNVNFGMMAFIVDNNLSSFYDMVTERNLSADITTKFGKPAERLEYSELISIAFDRVLREWDEYLFNIEQDLLDMLLYSKGVETWEDSEGCMPEHISADDLLVSQDTKVSLCNWTEIVVKRSYTLLELYKKIKDEKSSDDMGWNRKAVIEAMRFQRTNWKNRTSEDFMKGVSDGDITFGGHMKERVDVFVVYIREFNDKVSKYVVLQDYAPAVSLTKQTQPKGVNEEDWKNKVIDNQGFLYTKSEYANNIYDIFAVFMDCAGNGIWHRVPSLGEKIFVHCRQYDVVMNAIMDGIKMNMSLMLQATSPDAAQKIKEIIFGPYAIIPSEVPFVQQRVQLPTQEATTTVAFMMQDMRNGLGEYRTGERAKGGEAMTATQRQLDAAEAAKLTGTQLKRYNGQFTFFFRKLFKRLIELNDTEKDYEHCKKFKQYLDEQGVPKEAYKWENIDKIESNMLAGAGSPSYKLMAAKETLQVTNITPNGEGQRKAMEDALAALHGRANVRRYMKEGKPDLTWNERIAHWENSLLSDMTANPSDVQVRPTDNHLYHISVHMDTMEKTILIVEEKLKAEKISETFGEIAAFKLLNIGAHTLAHLKQVEKDGMKEDLAKQYMARLNAIQRSADKIAQNMSAMKEKKKGSFDPANDPDIQKAVAMGQIEIDTKQKLSNIKIGSIAAGHAQRQEIDQDKAANEMAIARAKEKDRIRTKEKLEAKAEAKKAASKKTI